MCLPAVGFALPASTGPKEIRLVAFILAFSMVFTVSVGAETALIFLLLIDLLVIRSVMGKLGTVDSREPDSSPVFPRDSMTLKFWIQTVSVSAS
jgi:hypothetical protein